MSFWKDWSTVLNKNTLRFVDKYHEKSNIYTFKFTCDKELDWKAGQHVILMLGKYTKGLSLPFRPFSISSSPDEEIYSFSTRITATPSEFKKALMNLKNGDIVQMRGPFGPFYIKSDKTAVFIAGGIGITPFRSLIRDSLAKDTFQKIHLVFSDDRGEYLYKDEFDELATMLQSFSIEYVNNGTLIEYISKYIEKYSNDACYYIAGSKKFVSATKAKLINSGISKDNILNEGFIGI